VGATYPRGRDASLDAILAQLVEEGLADEQDNDVLVPWRSVFDALDEARGFGLAEAELDLPPIGRDVVLSVAHDGSLSRSDFGLRLEGFFRHGQRLNVRPHEAGTPWFVESSGSGFLLTRESYALAEMVAAARSRTPAERSQDANRRLLAQVRTAAEQASAELDLYLRRTRVLMPSELLLRLDEAQTPAGRVITVAPGFEGEPDGWLEAFDLRRDVNDVYRVTEGAEYCEIIIEPDVREALTAIKRVPGRRVAGAEAQRLLTNPFAYFGPDISHVFNEENVEHTLSVLRRNTCRFIPQLDADDPAATTLLIEPLEDEAEVTSTLETFAQPEMLGAFCRIVQRALDDETETFEWRRHDLLLEPDTPSHLDALRDVSTRWADQEAASDADERPHDVEATVDLALYSDRVQGIGIETPYAILVIPRPKQLGAWLPDDTAISFVPTGSPNGTPTDLTVEQLQQLPDLIEAATDAGLESVVVPGVAEPIPLQTAVEIVRHAPKGSLEDRDDGAPERTSKAKERGPRPGLLIASNIDDEDYVERRAAQLSPPLGARPRLPGSLRADVALKEHQEVGVAWLQHLIDLGPDSCRGALLADDMGLGKTLQLLAVALAHLERGPSAPILVVAPVTLLENWRAELDRFFKIEEADILSLYGASIRALRAGPDDVDPGLYATRRKLLRRNWLGRARVVLTTYETVRDLEFSLAEVDWSIVICDEAQKIKNPNALVSRAAKKLKADFRIAATGTPVENSLRDIWSIFDFIQPGLLAPLNRFGRDYQRPIEARSDTQRERLDSLRRLLAPQILRRTKHDVARDLPAKELEPTCRELSMSQVQLGLYLQAVSKSRSQEYASERDRALSTLHVLQYLRRVCCDPRPPGDAASADLPIDDYRQKSPKFDWLVGQLEEVKRQNEKAIVFLEARDIQRQLKLYLDRHFDLDITIVNGESSTVVGSDMSRQRLIDRFQAKSGFNLILLSPLAAGVGLNIQAANHVIHYMRHWNPAREDQATDRAYRIGQERVVTVYTPIVRGPGWASFDERLDELLEFKRALADDMYNGTEDVAAADLEDLLLETPS
jgi:hypothetical protein